MKIAFLLFFLFATTYSYAQNDYISPRERRLLLALEKPSEDDLWELKESLTQKAHTAQNFSTIFLSFGAPATVYGGIQAAQKKGEDAYLIIGAGFASIAIGSAISYISMRNKKSVIWIDKELSKRNSAKITVGMSGAKLHF